MFLTDKLDNYTPMNLWRSLEKVLTEHCPKWAAFCIWSVKLIGLCRTWKTERQQEMENGEWKECKSHFQISQGRKILRKKKGTVNVLKSLLTFKVMFLSHWLILFVRQYNVRHCFLVRHFPIIHESVECGGSLLSWLLECWLWAGRWWVWRAVFYFLHVLSN